MMHRFKQPYSTERALRVFGDVTCFLEETLGKLAGASVRPNGDQIIRVWATFLEGFDKAHAARDMQAIHALARWARGAALDVLVASEEGQEAVQEGVSG